jgi:hypothetical protein
MVSSQDQRDGPLVEDLLDSVLGGLLVLLILSRRHGDIPTVNDLHFPAREEVSSKVKIVMMETTGITLGFFADSGR